MTHTETFGFWTGSTIQISLTSISIIGAPAICFLTFLWPMKSMRQRLHTVLPIGRQYQLRPRAESWATLHTYALEMWRQWEISKLASHRAAAIWCADPSKIVYAQLAAKKRREAR